MSDPRTQEKEGKKALKAVREGGRSLMRLNDRLRVDALSTKEQREQQQMALIKNYENEIIQVKQIYPNREYPHINSHPVDVILNYYDYLKGKTPQGDAQPDVLGDVHEKARAREAAGQSETDVLMQNMDANISDAQKNGLTEIAKWMYRNSDDTGALSLAPHQERFVRVLLNLPARMKLFMYYLIENKRRHNPGPEDIIMSQMDYVPNLKNFKEQMVATKWKLWKRIDGSYVYWHKLEEAMQISRSCTDSLSAFGNMGPADTVDRLAPKPDAQGSGAAQGPGAVQGSGAAQGPGTAQGQQHPALAIREARLASLMDAVKSHKGVLEKKSKGKNHQQEIEESAQRVKGAYVQLAYADNDIKALEAARAEEAIAEDTGEAAGSYTGIAGTAIGMGTHLNKVGMAASFVSWNISDMHLENMNLSSGVFSSVAGAAALAAAIIGIVNICRSAKGETGDEIRAKSFQVVQSFAAIAATLTTGAYTLKNAKIVGDAAKTAAGEAALATAKKAGGAAQIVTGTLDIFGGVYQMGRASDREMQMHDARNELRRSGTMTAEEEENVDEIAALQGRISESREGSGAMKMISGTLQVAGGILAAAGVTGPVGAILSGIATGINLAISVKEYFERKKNRIETIDKYIKMDDIEALVRPRIAADPSRRQLLSDLREQIRAEVIASLGFSGEDSFYVHITRTYARFLRRKAFYKDDGQTAILATDPEAKNPYAKMIQSFGLKAIFPARQGDEPKPDVDTLASKMKI